MDSDALLIREAFRKARIANPIYRVATGGDALSYVQGEGRFADRKRHPSPDIVLLDLGLPDTTGLKVLERIRSSGNSAKMPVVVVTGSDNPKAEAEAEQRGANAFFRKALQFEDLVSMVRKIGAQWSLTSGDSDKRL